MSSLNPWDYVVFSAFLLIFLSVGLYFRLTGGKQKTLQEYMLGNRQMSALPVSMSLMTSYISAVTILGTASENYLHGTQYLLLNFSYIIGTPIVNFVFLPVFFNNDSKISIYQYLEARFGTIAKLATASAFALQMLLYMGVVLEAPSLALSAVTGISRTVAVLSVGLTCTIYSVLGGIKAVLFTDLLQGILMFVTILIIIGKGIADVGSVSEIFSILNKSGHLEFFNFNPDPTERHTVWGTLIGGLFTFLSLHAVNQAQIQRLRTLPSLKLARWSLFASSVFVVFLSFLVGFMGLLMFVKYRKCDPLLSHQICKADQLVPFFVMNIFDEYPGLTGLFISGLMSGSLSTISTSINSLAAVGWEDFIQPILKKWEINYEPSITPITKCIAFVIGLSCIAMAFVAQQFTSILTAAMTIFGIVGGPILGVFSLGMLTTFVSEKAVVPSFLISLATGMWISFGQPRPSVERIPGDISECVIYTNMSCPTAGSSASQETYLYPYTISYLWYSFIGFTLTTILGVVLSAVLSQKALISKELLSPIHSINRSKSDPRM